MTTLSASEARNKRKSIKSMATQIKHFLDSADHTQLSRFDLTERMKKLIALWDQYDEVQIRIKTLELVNLGEADDTALHKQHIEERASFETPYFNLVARFEAVLNTSNFAKFNRAALQNSEPVSQFHYISLYKISHNK